MDLIEGVLAVVHHMHPVQGALNPQAAFIAVNQFATQQPLLEPLFENFQLLITTLPGRSQGGFTHPVAKQVRAHLLNTGRGQKLKVTQIHQPAFEPAPILHRGCDPGRKVALHDPPSSRHPVLVNPVFAYFQPGLGWFKDLVADMAHDVAVAKFDPSLRTTLQLVFSDMIGRSTFSSVLPE